MHTVIQPTADERANTQRTQTSNHGKSKVSRVMLVANVNTVMDKREESERVRDEKRRERERERKRLEVSCMDLQANRARV